MQTVIGSCNAEKFSDLISDAKATINGMLQSPFITIDLHGITKELHFNTNVNPIMMLDIKTKEMVITTKTHIIIVRCEDQTLIFQ